MAFAAPLIPLAATVFGSSTGLSALAGGVGAVTALSQGLYQSAVARNNSKIAVANAEKSSVTSQENAARLDRDNAAAQAEQAVAQAASGTNIDSRSNVQARALSVRVGREEAVDTARAGSEEARRSLQEAANFRAESRNARTQGLLNAAGQVINTGNDLRSRSVNQKSTSLIQKRKKRFS